MYIILKHLIILIATTTSITATHGITHALLIWTTTAIGSTRGSTLITHNNTTIILRKAVTTSTRTNHVLNTFSCTSTHVWLAHPCTSARSQMPTVERIKICSLYSWQTWNRQCSLEDKIVPGSERGWMIFMRIIDWWSFNTNVDLLTNHIGISKSNKHII